MFDLPGSGHGLPKIFHPGYPPNGYKKNPAGLILAKTVRHFILVFGRVTGIGLKVCS
jgi:hypothetical protein